MFNDIVAAERSPMLDSPYRLTFADLYSVAGAGRIDDLFVAALFAADPVLAERFVSARARGRVAEHEGRVGAADRRRASSRGFSRPSVRHRGGRARARGSTSRARAALRRKRQFVQRKAMNAHNADVAADVRRRAPARGYRCADRHDATAYRHSNGRSRARSRNGSRTTRPTRPRWTRAQRYAAWASHTPQGRAAHRGGVLFRSPRKLDLYRLVPAEKVALNDVDALQISGAHGLRRRDGFALTDPGTDLVGALDQAILRLVPRARKGFMRTRIAGEKSGGRRRPCQSLQEIGFRRNARRLPAGRADFRVPQASRRRLARRRAGDDLRRQPDGGNGPATGCNNS